MRSSRRGHDEFAVTTGSRRGPCETADVLRVITQAMSNAAVRRLVVTSVYPIVGDKPRVPIAILRFVLARNYADTCAMEQLVMASDLDWTIARLNRLTDKRASGGLRVTPDLFDKPSAHTRADAAATLVTLVEDGAYARTAVNVSGPA